MKNLLIIGLIFFIGGTMPELTNEVVAQGRSAVVHRKGKVVVKRRAVKKPLRKRAHVVYRGLPKYGAAVKVVPKGAVVLTSGYYYSNGLYYWNSADGFIVVRPKRGVRVRMLPPARKAIVVSNRKYYYYYGTFYQPINEGEFEVIDPPVGAVVDALPEGYQIIEKDGTEYYVLNNVYYKEVNTKEFEEGIGYEVVMI